MIIGQYGLIEFTALISINVFVDKGQRTGYYLGGKSHGLSIGGDDMAVAVASYDAKMDSKKRITLRNASYEYYHVEMFEDGRIVLEPRELVAPLTISEKSLAMMDQAMENLKHKNVSPAVDLSAFKE